MDTETIDRLFLELSQFTTAKTKRELELASRIAQLEAELHKYKCAFEDTAHELKEIEEELSGCRAVRAELSALVGCTSPSGEAELDQVRLLQEKLAERR